MCKVQITASVDRKRDKMIVNSAHLEHNHELSKNMYMRYPEVIQQTRDVEPMLF